MPKYKKNKGFTTTKRWDHKVHPWNRKKRMVSHMDDREPGESLAEFVRRVRREQRITAKEVAHASGSAISRTTVWRIENSQTLNVTPEKLRALAKGLGVLEDEVLEAARRRPPTRPTADDARPARMVAYFWDSPPEVREYMHLYCEWMWRHAKRRRKRGESSTSPETTIEADETEM